MNPVFNFILTFSVFGVPLAAAVERDPTFDGVCLTRVVRLCVDYIKQTGLTQEGTQNESYPRCIEVIHLRSQRSTSPNSCL